MPKQHRAQTAQAVAPQATDRLAEPAQENPVLGYRNLDLDLEEPTPTLSNAGLGEARSPYSNDEASTAPNVPSGYVNDGAPGREASAPSTDGGGRYGVEEPAPGWSADLDTTASAAQPPAPVAPGSTRHQIAPKAASYGGGTLSSTPLLPQFRGEERPGNNAPLPQKVLRMDTPTTYYAPGEEYAVHAEQGKLTKPGPDGAEALDSNETKRLWKKDKHQRLNYAVTPEGGIYASDPRHEVQEKGQRSNHSSLVGGRDLAGAGTMRVTDGKVEELDNSSGHYQPDAAMLYQSASYLQQEGVMDPARSSVTLHGTKGNEDLTISTQELNAYGEDFDRANRAGPELRGKFGGRVESTIRDRHVKKDPALGQIRKLGTDDGMEEGVSTQANIAPSTVRAKTAPPASAPPPEPTVASTFGVDLRPPGTARAPVVASNGPAPSAPSTPSVAPSEEIELYWGST